MSALRPATTPGKTRICPHCKATILESASVCPGCNGHLRFDAGAAQRAAPRTALQVEGTLRPPPDGEPWEYHVIVSVRNERGEEIGRHVVGVGAMRPAERRTFTLSVDVLTRAQPARSADPPPQTRPAAPGTAAAARPASPPVPPRPTVQPGPKPIMPVIRKPFGRR